MQGKQRIRVAIILMGLLFSMFLPTSSRAYITIDDVRWPNAVAPAVGITLEHLRTTVRGQFPYQSVITIGEWQREIRAAMQIWNREGTQLQFIEVPASEAEVDVVMVPNSVIPTLYADVCFNNTPCGSSPVGEIRSAIIRINEDQYWDIKDWGPTYDIFTDHPDPQTAIAHELGHVLGLRHSDNKSSLMYKPVDDADKLLRAFVHRYLDDDDRAAIHYLYGSGANLPQPSLRDDASFVSDISVANGTVFLPNQSFIKTWRLRNSGTSTWSTNYQLTFTEGDQLGAPSFIRLPNDVAPGAEVDVSVPMNSPRATGSYESYWRLSNGQNARFGDPVWTKILVNSTSASTPIIDGIEVVNVSSHSVQPGEQFSPSISVRVTSGRLDASRGDHLHARPENLSNTLGGYPVQPVRRSVGTGEIYTFDSSNDPSFRMTAPTQPGTYRSIWQLRVGGNYLGPQIPIQITVQAPSGNPDAWSVDYWVNRDLNGSPSWHTTENNTYVFHNWESGSPGGGIPADFWSVRYLKTVYFPGGDYRFHCLHDDGCRIAIDGNWRINTWSGSGETNWEGQIPQGNHEVRIEYFEITGGARLEAFWQGPGFLPIAQVCDPTQWCAEYWGNTGLSGDPAVRVNEGSDFLNRSWGTGSSGYGLPTDNFSARWKRTVPLACGRYRFTVHSDDAVRLRVGDTSILDEWGARGADFQREIDLAGGNLPVIVDYLEVGGDASINVQWELLTACPPPCPDTAFEPDNTQQQARAYVVNSTEVHAFCTPNDDDWVSFAATAGTMYRIATLDQNFPWWTNIDVFKSDGTLLTSYLGNSAWIAPETTTYFVRVKHSDGTGDLSYTYKLSIVTVSEVCTDTFEPDNLFTQARMITLGSTISRAFCVQYDDDWLAFTAKAGTAYRIETLELLPFMSTRVYLYGTNGSTLLAEDEGPPRLIGTYASILNWRAPANGVYYVRVRQFGNSGNPSDIYKVRVSVGNRALNPSFEDDTNNDVKPDRWTVNSFVSRSNEVVHSGQYAIKHTSTRNSAYTVSQKISNLSGGLKYLFSGWVNIPPTTDTFTFLWKVQWRDAANIVVGTDTLKSYSTPTNGWDNTTSSLTAPSTARSATIQMSANSLNTTIYVDDVNFTAGGNANPTAWTIDQWQPTSALSIEATPVHSGLRAASISSQQVNDARWIQHVPVRPNTNYVVSGWIRTENVRSDFIGASIGLVDDWARTPDLRGTQDWTYVDVTINSGTRTELLIGTRLGHFSNTTTGRAWFDDLAVREQLPNGLGPNLLINPSFEE